MDLNMNGIFSSCNDDLTKNNNFGDRTLCLDYFSHGGNKNAACASSRTNTEDHIIASNASDDGCRLVLGLGPTPSSYTGDSFSVAVSNSKGLTSTVHDRLSSESDSILKLCLSGGNDKISNVFKYSVSMQNSLNAPCYPNQMSLYSNRSVIPVVDEGSTSAKKSGGYMPSLLLAPIRNSGKALLQTQCFLESGTKCHSHLQLRSERCATTDYSMSTISEPATTGTSLEYRESNVKKCKFLGCTKGARGATGLCIGHGGGERCQKPGCNKGAETRTAYCKAHGGGRRCQHLGCTKSAEGRTDYCIAHGGGRRCGYAGGCTKAARGKSGLCIRHGGGKRCKIEGCTRSAEGQIGLCISHGGGRRCQFHGCTKSAQGSTMFCKAHGGGKRCIFAGCTKGAEGNTPLCKGHGGGKRCLFHGGGICPKSVHGGTNFCVAHGGGKRCIVPGCTKSARGRTDCCVRHGGGKRCKVESCNKSAQGSTAFCKAHGGGKRCSWKEGKCEKIARGKNGLCTAHSNIAQEWKMTNGGMIAPGLFHGLVPATSTVLSSFKKSHSCSGMSVVSDSIDSLENPVKTQHFIPPQVLLPLSMKSSSSYTEPFSYEKQEKGSHGRGSRSIGVKNLVIPEGRVHGGGLMCLLGGDLSNYIDGV